uniref:Uncharacterized protein n=1 Tax=Magallana gigas TaxID=29159 RepID=A0A8W8MN92_MAGGI
MQDVETNDEASSTLWIVAFCISVVIHIIRISATLIRRKTFLKPKSTTEKVHISWRSGFNSEQTVRSDNPCHYQEVGLSQNENTYQTLNQQ